MNFILIDFQAVELVSGSTRLLTTISIISFLLVTMDFIFSGGINGWVLFVKITTSNLKK
ncbi:MAG: hypothetical protein LW721_03770 [Flammeovirgaceae bacterium]|nr:hypothetical protein [Flammeovirgaceae bacterium]